MIINTDNFTEFSIGAKAERLFRMKQHGLNVPELFCVTNETQEAEVRDHISRNFPAGALFSVRSSASAEDSSSFSFAGQLGTFLFVPADKVWEKTEQCRASADTEGVAEYLRINALSRGELRINVIVQEMVDAECSGVIFTANPQGILSETVITVGAGTGDNVVEDKVAVSTYYCDRSDKSFYAVLS